MDNEVTTYELNESELEVSIDAAKSHTVVYAIVRADPQNRFVRADGAIDGRTFATATLQDATSAGVPSGNRNSLTLVVPRGSSAQIRLVNGGPKNLIVRSFAL